LSVRYTEAETDLADALAYIAARSPAAAQDLYERVTALVTDLDAGALDGPKEQLKIGEKLRSWPVYPFRIYYERRGATLYVLRFYHQARRPIVRRRRRSR
jgi:plasmid stabilization system protein ParE